MKKQRNIFLILFILLFCVFFLSVFSERWYLMKPNHMMKAGWDKDLLVLMAKAKESGDYPMGAELFYRDSLIGFGFNTVKRDTNAIGHAEVNALKMAFKSYGVTQFKSLNRNFLVMISSHEPCLMCKGLLNFYDIPRVYFFRKKQFSHWFENEKRMLEYDYREGCASEKEAEDLLIKPVIK